MNLQLFRIFYLLFLVLDITHLLSAFIMGEC